MIRILVIGDINLDVLADLPSSLPDDGEVRTDVRVEPGGSAANFARAAASFGARVEFIGCVGEDPVGDILVESLVRFGVIPHVQRSSKASGTIVSLSRGGGKTMLCSRGANDMIDLSLIDEEWFDRADHLHMSGYAFLSNAQRAAARRAIDIAKSHGMSVSIDPPPANLIMSFGVEHFLTEIKTARIVLPNLDEGKIMTAEKTPEGIVDALSTRFPVGVLTMDRKGSLAWDEKERSLQRTEVIDDVDPTGAGDAFAAGFVVSYVEQHDLERANKAGTTSAHQVLEERMRRN